MFLSLVSLSKILGLNNFKPPKLAFVAEMAHFCLVKINKNGMFFLVMLGLRPSTNLKYLKFWGTVTLKILSEHFTCTL